MAIERKVSLNVTTETTGATDIKALVVELEKLAAQGGDAAPELNKLASEIKQLTEAGAVAEKLQSLSTATSELKEKVSASEASLSELRKKLDEAKASTKEYSDAQTKAVERVDAAKIAVIDMKAALALHKVEVKASGKATVESVEQTRQLEKALKAASDEVKASKAALVQSNKELSAAGKAENELASAIAKTEKSMRSANTQIENGKTSLESASNAAKQFGINTDNLANEQTRLSADLGKVAAAGRELISAYSSAAQQAMALEQVNLDEQMRQQAVAAQKAAEYIQWWSSALNTAEKEAKALEQSKLDEQLRQQAVAAQKAAEYVQWWSSTLNEAEKEAKALEQSKLDEQLRQQAVAAQKAAEYTQWWADALANADKRASEAAASAKALEQLNLDEQMRQQAVAAQKAAEYTQWWADALTKADRKAAETAATTKMLGERIDNAFSVVGVRSANAIQQEIVDIQQALMKLAANTKTTGAEFDRAFASGTARIEKLKSELNGTSGAVGGVSKSAGVAIGMMKQLAAAYGGMELAQQFILATMALENNIRALKAVTGSAQGAALEMNFMRTTADRLGVNVNDLTKTYIGFLAATKGTSIEGERARAVFTSVSNALGQIGASSYQTERAFTAITQMASKGVVSMEEMRQQLGEALPGAFTAAAKGMGVTTAELTKMIASGTLLTTDFLPALKKGLDETFTEGGKRVEGFQQAWERLKQSMFDFSTSAGGGKLSGFIAGLTGSFATLFDLSARGYRRLQQQSDDSTASMRKNNTLWANDIATAVETLNSRWDKYIAKLKKADDAEQERRAKTLAGSKVESDASRMAREAFEEEYKAVTELLSASQNGSSAADRFAQAQTRLAAASEKTANTISQGGVNSAAVQYLYVELAKKADAMRVASEKLVEAKRLEGETSVRIARLTGDENLARSAATSAAIANVQATDAVTAARTAELSAMREGLRLLAEEVAASTVKDETKVKRLEAMRTEIELKSADLEKSKQLISVMQQEVVTLQLADKTYLDNSNRLYEYQRAMDVAIDRLTRLEANHIKGIATQEMVDMQRTKAAIAIGMYRDAVNDTVAAKQREGAVLVATAQLSGQDVLVRNAQTKATAENTKAIEFSITSSQRELEKMRERMVVLQTTVALTDEARDAKEKETKELQRNIDAKEQSIKVAQQNATQMKIEEEAARVNAEAYKDNSKRVGEYGAAARTAQIALADLMKAEKEGKATADQVNEARIRAAGATRLYADALKDATAAEERKLDALKRDEQLTTTSLQLDLEHAKTLEAVAKAHGDETAALAAKAKQKEIEIQMARAAVRAMMDEADQMVAVANAMQAEAERTGTLDAAKQAEIQARRDAAEMRRLEANIAYENLRQLEEEVAATDKLALSVNELNDAKKKLKNNDRTDIEYQTSGAANIDFESEMYKMGASVEQVKAAMGYVNDLFKQQMILNPIRDALFAGDTITKNMRAAVNEALNKARSSSGTGSTTVSTDTGTLLKTNPLTGTATQSNQPVIINIAGQKRTINVQSTGDADTLASVLRELTEGASRA